MTIPSVGAAPLVHEADPYPVATSANMVSGVDSRGRIPVVDTLRGVASIAIVWFHLVHVTGLVPENSWLDVSGTYGWAFAEVFFVISGFVVPYALLRSNYRIADFGRFILKRMARLQPPYLTVIAASLVFAVTYRLGPDRTAFPYSPMQLLAHVGFVNAFVGYRWIDPVYWMLGVEVQFYVLAGVAFPMIMKRTLFWLIAAPLCIVASFAIHGHDYVFQYLPFFLLGIAALHFRRRIIRAAVFVAVVVLLSICAWFRMGTAPAMAGTVAALLIGFFNFDVRPLSALGTISYSLFLVHLPVLLLVKVFIPDPITLASHVEVAALNVVGGLAAAWILYRTVELPSIRLSRRIRYERPSQNSESAVAGASG